MRFIFLFFFFFFINFIFTQEIKTGFGNSSGPFIEFTSSDFSGINYKVFSDNNFKEIQNGTPFYNNGLIFPSEPDVNSSKSIKISIVFSKKVDSLKIRLIDLDENGNSNSDPEEYITEINPKPFKTKGVLDQNPVFLVGNMLTPDDNNSQYDNNNASGWMFWDVSVDTLSFVYNRPGALYGIILDSIYFQLNSNKCNQILEIGKNTYLCEGDSVLLYPFSVIKGKYLWSTNDTTNTITAYKSGWYKLVVQDSLCIYKDSTFLNFNSFQINTKTFEYTKCDKETILLTAPIWGNSYEWQDGASVENRLITDFGQFTVIIKNYCKIDTIHFIVTDKNCLCVFDIPDQSICVNDSILVGFDYDISKDFLWNTGETTSKILINRQGKYWLEIVNESCSYTDTFYINFRNIDVVNHFQSIMKCTDEKVLLSTELSGHTFVWYNGVEARQKTESIPGKYNLNVYSYCRIDSITFDVSDRLCDCYVYLPNSFSPNGDEFNNTFDVNLVCDHINFHLVIFNRWGEVLFESFNSQQSWDGTYNNQIVMEGVYIYKLEYYDVYRQQKIDLKGHVNVVY